jgi:hypothetical protein
MKLTKQQKELALLGILVAGIIIVLFSWFGGEKAPKAIEVLGDTPADGVAIGTAPAVTGAAASGSYDFLPDGFDLDLSVLDDKRFKALNAPSYPTVNESEYGQKENPFVK